MPALSLAAGAAAPGRFLIITADDFGLHPSINEAIEQGNRKGVLTAASLMVAAPAAADAVRRARELPGLAVGLHVVLADGEPMLPPDEVPDLVGPDGRFGSNMVKDGFRYFALPPVRRQLEAEIRAQFEAFKATGLPLDHVNAHKHFHLHPTLFGFILAIGRDYGLKAVRLPAEPLWFAPPQTRAAAAASQVFLAPWLSLMRSRMHAAGVECNDQVFGVASTGGMDEARFLTILERLPPGVTEIYLHPATQSGTAVNASQDGYRHADELAALVSPKVKAAIQGADLPCGGFAGIAAARGSWRQGAR